MSKRLRKRFASLVTPRRPKKKRAHSLSAEEIALHNALNRHDLPHYLLITSPPVDLWILFSKTLKAARNV
ncbi:unnamed protein product [Brassica oleracea]